MAKKSVTNRNNKRISLVKKFKAKRDKLRADASNINLSDEERWEAARKLQDLPRDSSPSRRRNRCKFKTCSRPRAYNNLTGLCRLHMRKSVMKGEVPGMDKASW